MFPTLTGFALDMNNPTINRSVSIKFNRKISSGISLANPYMPGYTHNQNIVPTSSKLLVSNLPLSFDEDSVYKFLKTFGKIKSLELIKDAMTGKYLVIDILILRDNVILSMNQIQQRQTLSTVNS
jgi:RNA recognition motif-containing protein